MTSQFPASPPPASDFGIAEAVEGIEDLGELPISEHVARFTAVHEALTAALSSIDEV